MTWLDCHQCRVFDVLTFIEGAGTVYVYLLLTLHLPTLIARLRRGRGYRHFELEDSER